MKYVKSRRCANRNPHESHMWNHWGLPRLCNGVIRVIKKAEILGVSMDPYGAPGTSIRVIDES